jgi:mediator of RNA polymerase II transcription subunit 14
VVNIDPRTGRLNLRDTGNLATAKRGPRFLNVSDQLNENPGMLFSELHKLRLALITELVEHKANYLGLQFYRTRNFSREGDFLLKFPRSFSLMAIAELSKLGPAARGTMYIQLLSFPSHYLVLVVTDDDFRYALINVAVLMDSPLTTMVMEDIGWLNVKRIRGESEYTITEEASGLYPVPPLPRKKGDQSDGQEKRSGKWVPGDRLDWPL